MEAVISGEVEGGLIDINLADHMREDLTEASLTTGQSISNGKLIPFGAYLWNDLDLNIRNSCTVSAFKFAVKKKLFNIDDLPILKSKTLYSLGDRFINTCHTR